MPHPTSFDVHMYYSIYESRAENSPAAALQLQLWCSDQLLGILCSLCFSSRAFQVCFTTRYDMYAHVKRARSRGGHNTLCRQRYPLYFSHARTRWPARSPLRPYPHTNRVYNHCCVRRVRHVTLAAGASGSYFRRGGHDFAQGAAAGADAAQGGARRGGEDCSGRPGAEGRGRGQQGVAKPFLVAVAGFAFFVAHAPPTSHVACLTMKEARLILILCVWCTGKITRRRKVVCFV